MNLASPRMKLGKITYKMKVVGEWVDGIGCGCIYMEICVGGEEDELVGGGGYVYE